MLPGYCGLRFLFNYLFSLNMPDKMCFMLDAYYHFVFISTYLVDDRKAIGVPNICNFTLSSYYIGLGIVSC